MTPENPPTQKLAMRRRGRGAEVCAVPVVANHLSPAGRPAPGNVDAEDAAGPRSAADGLELMSELAAAAEPCFDTADRLAVYCEMNLGDLPHAVDELVAAVVRKDHLMPAGLVGRLQQWLADDPIDDNGDFRQRLSERIARVRTR